MIKIATLWNDHEIWDDNIIISDTFEVPEDLLNTLFKEEATIIDLEPKNAIYLDKLKRSGYIAYSVLESTNEMIKYSIITLRKPENI